MEDYLRYAEIFNTGNDELLVSTFFSFPFTFTTPFVNQRFETEEEFVHQLKIYHHVRECIDPQQITYGKRKVFVNLDIVFHSCVEWLDFPYGPVRPGDLLITRAFVLYTLNEQNRIVHVEEMYWPAGYLNKPIQRLGASDTQRAGLEAFIAGFNARRFDTVGEYYTEDCIMELPLDQKLIGRQSIVEGLKAIAEKALVSFDVQSIICDDGGICITTRETFKALVDVPDLLQKPLKTGEEFSRVILVVMALKGGLISSSQSRVLE